MRRENCSARKLRPVRVVRAGNGCLILGQSLAAPTSLRAPRRRPGATGRWWGQFHLREARRFRQRRFHGRHFDEFGFARFDVFSEAHQKLRDLFRRDRAKCGCSFGGGGERGIAIRPGADGKFIGQHFTGGRIFGAEGAGGCRRAPLAGDENGLVWRDSWRNFIEPPPALRDNSASTTASRARHYPAPRKPRGSRGCGRCSTPPDAARGKAPADFRNLVRVPRSP